MFVATSWGAGPSHTFVHIYIVAPRSSDPSKHTWLAWSDPAEQQLTAEQFRSIAGASQASMAENGNVTVPIQAWIDVGIGAGWGKQGAPDCAKDSCPAQVRKQLLRMLTTVQRGTVPEAKQGIGCQYCGATHVKFRRADAVWQARPHPQELHWDVWASLAQARAGAASGGKPEECAWLELQAVLEAVPLPGENADGTTEALRATVEKVLAHPPATPAGTVQRYQHEILRSVAKERNATMSALVMKALKSVCSADAFTVIDETGRTLLHSVVTPDAAKQLLASGLDVNAESDDKETPLHHAIVQRSSVLVAAFLEHGADTEVLDGMGMTSLIQSAMMGDKGELSGLLLKARAAVDAVDGSGRSALHWAVRASNEELIAVLLQAGANPELPDRRGTSIIDVAKDKQNAEILRMLSDGVSAPGTDPEDLNDRATDL
eukprot:TRINITY_DN30227_c0_g1_i1.p1 TRINITY_DN30227_c0_g1~~TRINITY_DN30227_c0_g1_i1.p1  ORF type:complete len:433 (+),score=55.64 TRINITY_DN30227_c0_g1_i1:842-2140(+)